MARGCTTRLGENPLRSLHPAPIRCTAVNKMDEWVRFVMIAIRSAEKIRVARIAPYSFDILSSQHIQSPHLSLLEERREEGDGHCGFQLNRVR